MTWLTVIIKVVLHNIFLAPLLRVTPGFQLPKMNQRRDGRTRENRERADTNTQLSSDDWDTQTHSSQTTNRGPTNSVITLNNLFANSNASVNTTAAAKPAANPKMILHTTKRRKNYYTRVRIESSMWCLS